MSLAHAILTALHDEPASGYDLARRFETSLGFFWTASHQQIYLELKKMTGRGWLSAEAVPQDGRPDKTLYRLTPTGEEELGRWLAGPTRVRRGKDELFVKLYNVERCDRDALLTEVRARQAAHRERLALYERIRDRHYADPPSLSLGKRGVWLALSAGIRNERMYIDWCDEVVGLL